MTLDELNRLTIHPEELDRNTLSPLAELVEIYPYAQSIVMLYLLNLSILGDLRYEAELQRWAPYLPSREKLYLLTQLHMPLDEITPVRVHDPSDSFALIDEYLRRVAEREGPLATELEYDLADDHPATPPLSGACRGADYFSPEDYLMGTSELSLSGLTTTPVAVGSTSDLEVSMSDGESDPSDTLFTETLAAIYIRQGHYERAKQIIEGLSLKFPEKFSYFAVQLNFLEKLIDNASHN